MTDCFDLFKKLSFEGKDQALELYFLEGSSEYGVVGLN